MRTIIAGSRTITDFAVVEEAIRASGFLPSVVICGAARGVDMLGFDWGWKNGVPVESYPADWKQHGRRAGPIRNVIMASVADALIAVWDGQSSGTRHMIEEATRRRLKVYVHRALPPSSEGDPRGG